MTVARKGDLSGFRWHTGATLQPVADGERLPVLFRDIGPPAMSAFLRGGLQRLSGPTAPLLYLRTAAYVEPYTDYEPVGRLVFVSPALLSPWHSGVPEVFVAPVGQVVHASGVGFLPPGVLPSTAEALLRDVSQVNELREVFGRCSYEDCMADTLASLDRLNTETLASERMAAPLRRYLQSGTPQDRSVVRTFLHRHGVTEHDLCAAFHHVPRERRAHLREVLKQWSLHR